jgi:hypothetical protein
VLQKTDGLYLPLIPTKVTSRTCVAATVQNRPSFQS